jgi:DNA-binding CsgD family transcriptional regulator
MTSRRAEVRQGTPLTPREREVIALIAEDKSNKEIAQALGISTNTVQDYTQMIFERLGVRGRVGAAVWAVKQGIV